jgi:hypothetical protein
MIGLSQWTLGRYPLRRSDIDAATAASAIRTETASATRTDSEEPL